MGLHQAGKLAQKGTASGGGRIQTPDGVKGLLSDLDGNVDILGSGFGNGSDNLSSS